MVTWSENVPHLWHENIHVHHLVQFTWKVTRIALWDCCILMLSCRLTYETFVGNLHGYCSYTLKKCDSKKHTLVPSKWKEESFVCCNVKYSPLWFKDKSALLFPLSRLMWLCSQPIVSPLVCNLLTHIITEGCLLDWWLSFTMITAKLPKHQSLNFLVMSLLQLSLFKYTIQQIMGGGGFFTDRQEYIVINIFITHFEGKIFMSSN